MLPEKTLADAAPEVKAYSLDVDGDYATVRMRTEAATYPIFLRCKLMPEKESVTKLFVGDIAYRFPARYARMLEMDQRDVRPGWNYIYALIDPFDNRFRYIGKSERPRERLMNHCNERPTCHRTKWIQSVIAKGDRPIMLLLDRVPFDQDWRPCERDWIAYARSRGWPLTNGTDGGDGVVGLSPEARERIASAWRGRKHTPETLKKLGSGMRGKHHTEEAKAKMSAIQKNRQFSEVHRQRLSDPIRTFSDERVVFIRAEIAAGGKMRALGRKYGVNAGTIRAIRDGKYCYGFNREISNAGNAQPE